MFDADAVRARLEARFAPGWPASVGVPGAWLPHLDQLDSQLAELDPDYRLVQVKVKFGTMRYYIEDRTWPPCCEAWHEAHPLPRPSDEAATDAWDAAAEAHDASPEHVSSTKAREAVTEQMEALISAAEVASGSW